MKVDVKSNSVAVLGFEDGTAGQTETWFEDSSGYHIACFVHEADGPFEVDIDAENRKRVSKRTEFPTDGAFKAHPFIVTIDWVKQLKDLGIGKVLPLTSDNRSRLRQIEMCRRNGIELVSAIHPTATILGEARIEPGVWINARAIIGYRAELKAGAMVDAGVILNHHDILEEACQVDPGVVMAGFATVRECAYVHTGAVLINRVEVGADTIIGAGAVVIDNIPARCTAVGVPARVIKQH
jgi:acetyltransferase-like isoleucine patch superfamily enzyme